MTSAILARHGESVLGARGLVSGDVGTSCPLTKRGEAQARALGEALAGRRLDLCLTSELERTRQTAEIALTGRDVPRLAVPELNDPAYGDFEGRGLDEYRQWAWSHGSDEAPHGGESRRELVARYARGWRLVLVRPEESVLVVAHSLPIAYALGEPQPRMEMVDLAVPHELTADELRAAVERLEAWLSAPTW